MATAVLGKVSITPKGNYNSGTTYAKLDAVYDDASNASYLSLKDGNTATLANDGVNWVYLCRGIGVTTDNNFTNALKSKLDSLDGKTYSYEGKYFTINNPYKDGGSLHLKGQMHCHTTNSDGADSPTALVTAYKNAGYDFITITDHDTVLHNGATGITPDPGVSGITWIGNSIEESIFRHLIAYDIDTQSTSLNDQDVISYHRNNGKMVSIAHPNWPGTYSIPDDEIKSYYDFNFIEVYNSAVNQFGGNGEAQWDAALSFGKKIFATAVDDCHNIAASYFNGGWVVVHCNTNTKADILASLRKGNFYASTGNDITISLSDNTVTASSTTSSNFAFIGRDGRVLQENDSVTSASYIIKGDETYVRVKSVRTDNGKMAFSQPIFIDLIGDNSKVFADINDATSHNGMSRQAIINGNFDVHQSGTSKINPAYTDLGIADKFNYLDYPDGWTMPTTIQHSIQNITDEIIGAHSFYRIGTDGDGSGTMGNNTACGIYQRIENGTQKLCGDGRKVTVSFYARAQNSGKKVMVSFSQRYGSGGTPSANEQLGGQIITLTTNWARYSVTVETNTLSGKIFGSNNDDYLQVRFDWIWSVVGALNFAGITTTVPETFGGSVTFDLAQIQVNSGAVALPFQLNSISTELRNCQRYLKDLFGVYRMAFYTANELYFSVDTSDMRVDPTIINNGVESTDWNILKPDYSTVGTGWILSYDSYNHAIKATKSGHGLTDGILLIKNKGKLFASANL